MQVTTLAVGETADWLARDAHRSQGEFVLIVHQAPERDSSGGVDESTVRLLDALLETVSVRDAVRIAARQRGCRAMRSMRLPWSVASRGSFMMSQRPGGRRRWSRPRLWPDVCATPRSQPPYGLDMGLCAPDTGWRRGRPGRTGFVLGRFSGSAYAPDSWRAARR